MKLANYKPRGFHVLVEKLSIETKTKGGLILPMSGDDEKPYFIGKIVKLSKSIKDEELTIGGTAVIEKMAVMYELVFEDQITPIYSINVHNIIGSE